jgi:hypothetical protein
MIQVIIYSFLLFFKFRKLFEEVFIVKYFFYQLLYEMLIIIIFVFQIMCNFLPIDFRNILKVGLES